VNQLYPNARELFLTGELDWEAEPIAIALYDAGGVYNADHTLLSEVAGVQIDPGGELLNRVATDGYAVADQYTYIALTSASTVTYAVMYNMTGDVLIAHMDTLDGIPFLPTGGSYVIKGNGYGGAFFRI
jgi:hypothetical protein